MATRNRQGLATVDNEGELLEPGENAPAMGLIASQGDEQPSEAVQIMDAVRAALGESGGGDCYIQVERINGPGRPSSYLGRMDAAGFQLDDVAARYGAGTYRIRGVNQTGSGPRWFVNRTVQIETAKETIRELPAPVRAEDAIERAIRPLSDAMTQLANMVAQMAANQNRAPVGPSRQEILAELAQMKEIFGGGQPQTDQLGLVRNVLEIAKEFNAGGSGGETSDPMTQIVSKLIDVAGPAVAERVMNAQSAQQPQPQQARPALPAASAPAPTPTPTPQQPAEDNPEMLEKMMLAQAVKTITERAVKNLDPALTADLLLEQAGEARVRSFFGNADWFDQVCAIDARAAHVKPWFDTFANELAAALQGGSEV